MTVREQALEMHKRYPGKIVVESTAALNNDQDLAIAYTPGVAEPCKEIHAKKETVYDYTSKGNLVAIVSDGTAVLGLGDIGPEAAMPVMEGKAVLFKRFANVDAFPICLATKDVKEIIKTVKLLEPTFGGINLEDIAAPACFEIEERLKEIMDIPVFHDDQHGTAIVVLAGLLNAVKLVGKKIEEIKVTVNGAGAAAMATTKLLMSSGLQNVIMCDSKGAVYEGRTFGMNKYKDEIAKVTNKEKITGSLAEAVKGADVFIGLSRPNTLTKEMIKTMAKDPIVFAMANPVPEIMPDEAQEAGVTIMATGRSDYPNQINNVLAFPGLFRGTLDTRAKVINEEMKLAAAHAIAGIVGDDLSKDYIIPKPFNKDVAPLVAAKVAEAAMITKVARVQVDSKEIEEKTRKMVGR